MKLHYHNGRDDFPHGAGPSERGWYVYKDEYSTNPPDGPFGDFTEAQIAAGVDFHAFKMDTVLRNALHDLESRHKTTIYVALIRAGAADEHWLIFHPRDLINPIASVDREGNGFEY